MTTQFSYKYLLLPVILVAGLCGTSFGQDKSATPKAHDFPPLITTPLGQVSPAPDAKTGASVDKIVDTFFSLIGKNQIDQAYDTLTNGTKIAEKAEDVATLKSKTREAIKLFGDINGYDLVAIKNVGAHLMCATYLSLGKEFPLRWKFYFYKSDNAWRLVDIRVDDRLVDIFDERNPHPQPTDAADQ